MHIDWDAIPDPTLSRDLARAGIPLESAAALLMFPAVHAAWGNGAIQRFEPSVVKAGLQIADADTPQVWGLVSRWLTERPADPEALLDLTWRIFECLPVLHQLDADGSSLLARLTARVSDGFLGLFSITPGERVALAQVDAYLAGDGPETARRVALRWGREVEHRLPGLRLLDPAGVEGAVAGPALQDPLLEGLRVVDDPALMQTLTFAHLVLPGIDVRNLSRKAQRERQQELLPALRTLLDTVGEDARARLGAPRALEELEPWPAVRLALTLVCHGARNASETVDAEALRAAQASGDEARLEETVKAWYREMEAMVVHDRAPTAALLRNLASPGGLELLCRHYVRLVSGAYRGLKRVAPALQDTFVIPLFGVHDLRVRQAHAWCLFVDARRGLACAFDPTAADAYMDAHGAQDPFNRALGALDYSNLSALMARLVIARQQAGPRAALGLIESLEPAERLQVAARLLAQWSATHVLAPEEMARLLEAAPGHGVPEALATRIRELHLGSDAEVFGPARRQGVRAGLSKLLTAAGWRGAEAL